MTADTFVLEDVPHGMMLTDEQDELLDMLMDDDALMMNDDCFPTQQVPHHEQQEVILLAEEIKQLILHAQMDMAECRDVLIALEEVPHLVETETPWCDFLWTEDFDARKAALRLSRYWRARRQLFGEERWLRPLNMTGSGACNPEDISILRSGYYRVLVRPSGRGVVGIMDLTKLPKRYSTESITRVFFYMCTIFVKELNKGYIFIQVEYGKAIPNPMTMEAQLLLAMTLPTKLHECKGYIVQASFIPGRERLLDFCMYKGEKVWQQIMEQTQTSLNSVQGSSVRETYRKVQEITGGLEPEVLPLCVGGTYSFDMHHEWYTQRMQIEFSQILLPTSTIHHKLHYGLDALHHHYYANNDALLHKKRQNQKKAQKPKVLLQWVDHRQPENRNTLDAKYL